MHSMTAGNADATKEHSSCRSTDRKACKMRLIPLAVCSATENKSHVFTHRVYVHPSLRFKLPFSKNTTQQRNAITKVFITLQS